jgi:hypothetical protein
MAYQDFLDLVFLGEPATCGLTMATIGNCVRTGVLCYDIVGIQSGKVYVRDLWKQRWEIVYAHLESLHGSGEVVAHEVHPRRQLCMAIGVCFGDQIKEARVCTCWFLVGGRYGRATMLPIIFLLLRLTYLARVQINIYGHLISVPGQRQK